MTEQKNITIHVYKKPENAKIGDISIEYRSIPGYHYVCDMSSYAWKERVYVISIMLEEGWMELYFRYIESKKEIENQWGIKL